MNNIEYHGRFLIIANFSPVNDTKKKKDTIGLKLSKKKKKKNKAELNPLQETNQNY